MNLCKGPTWPRQKKKCIYFNSKGSYQIASILDMHVIIIKEKVDVNQDGPSLIIKAPPPPPSPKIAKDVNVFTYEKLIIHCFSWRFPRIVLRNCEETDFIETL